jgi:ABC-type phosphate transport system auxiliary subunit
MTRLPLPEPKKYFGVGAEHYTASQMHEYSDAENAALREQVREVREDAERYRWLRREQVALSLSSSTVAALVADQSELDAALEQTK